MIDCAKHICEKNPAASKWMCCFEFNVPRRGRRIDNVLVCDHVIIPIEFKFGAKVFARADQQQVEDYGLELFDFHSESHLRLVVPVLVATEATRCDVSVTIDVPRGVTPVHTSTYSNLPKCLLEIAACAARRGAAHVNPQQWLRGVYRPTPTIIEAAQVLYAGHDVREIAQSQAGASNLERTQNAIREAVEHARSANRKVICFVTGVPGAGKTLAGLNAVHGITDDSRLDANAVFLSGNGPLVKVLTEALARNDAQRTGSSLKEARRRSTTEIQNVHRFIRYYTHDDPSAPDESVLVFDEAQRAWDAAQSQKKFKRKESEPETILRILSRRQGWAVLVALVGGGQEIHDGEAGLGEWGRVLETTFSDWDIFVSEELLHGDTSTVGQTLFAELPQHLDIVRRSGLHLDIPIRSYRSPAVSGWVNAMLDGNDLSAAVLMKEMDDYPIVMTRSLDDARRWLAKQNRGLRKCGLVASSGARRLRCLGLDVRPRLDVANWFLADDTDVRSSSFLELPATEFDIQGLELDWIGVCWDADLRWALSSWKHHTFSGTRWKTVRSARHQQYLINKYRVLLTRAREGMVIFVPRGDESGKDETRSPDMYDQTAEFLQRCAVPSIGDS